MRRPKLYLEHFLARVPGVFPQRGVCSTLVDLGLCASPALADLPAKVLALPPSTSAAESRRWPGFPRGPTPCYARCADRSRFPPFFPSKLRFILILVMLIFWVTISVLRDEPDHKNNRNPPKKPAYLAGANAGPRCSSGWRPAIPSVSPSTPLPCPNPHRCANVHCQRTQRLLPSKVTPNLIAPFCVCANEIPQGPCTVVSYPALLIGHVSCQDSSGNTRASFQGTGPIVIERPCA